jgi:hypothetical protein
MKNSALALTLSVFCLTCSPLFSQTSNETRFDIGFSAGVVLPGTIKAADHSDFKPDETVSFKNASCLLLKGSADYYLTKLISGGINLQYVPIKVDDNNGLGINDITIHMAEIDGTIKARFQVGQSFYVKPGVALGFRKTFSKEPNAREKGLCLNLSVECQYFLSEKYYLLTDFGFFAQPYGGVQDIAYVKAGPIFYVNIGFGFSIK